MSVVPYLGAGGVVVSSVRHPLRCVYTARTIPQVIFLQAKFPTSLIALPSHVSYNDVLRYEAQLRMHYVCSKAGLMHPLRCMDILQYTGCRKLLIANVLVEFEKEMEGIVGHEEVEVLEGMPLKNSWV